MLDVTIYYKDGRRSFYDHVIAINDNTVNSIEIILKTDFDDILTRLIAKYDIDTIKVRVIE